MKTCGQCSHSVFIRETAPAGQCFLKKGCPPKIILRKSKACGSFENKEATKNGKNK